MSSFKISFIACGMLFLSYSGMSPNTDADIRAIALTFLNGLYHMDFEAAKSVATKETRRQVEDYASIMEFAGEEAKKEAARLSVTLLEVRQGPATATVFYLLHAPQKHDTLPQRLHLILEEGQWRVAWTKNDLFPEPEEDAENIAPPPPPIFEEALPRKVDR